MDTQNYPHIICRQNLLSSTSDDVIKFTLTKLKSINIVPKVQTAKMALQRICQVHNLIVY